VTHLMVNRIKGVFEHFQANLSFNPNDLTTMGIQATIDANRISTRQPQRDEYLRSDDFLQAAKFPTIAFQTTSCILNGERHELTGNLTLHGVTKPITFHTVFEHLTRRWKQAVLSTEMK
jgi:polyisoprenoid-binding protein YceI